MTVNTMNITSGPYLGNDIADEFSYDFRVETKNQLIVYETDDSGMETILTVDTDYTVAGIGDDAGGIITRTAGALPTSYKWYIRSNYVETQTTAFGSQGGFFPDVHESAMDKLTFLIQQINDLIGRSMRLSESYSGGEITTLPDPESLKFLRWKSDLSGFENVTSIPSVIINSTYLSYYDCDLEAAIAALGVTGEFHLIIDCKPNDLTGNLEQTDNITLEWRNGYSIGGAFTLTLNGSLLAGPYELFDSDVVVSGFDMVDNVLPEWFENTDVQKALDTEKNVLLLSLVYNFTTGLKMYSDQTLDATGRGKTILSFTGLVSGEYAISPENNDTLGHSRIVLKNFKILGDSTAGVGGVGFVRTHRSIAQNIRCENIGGNSFVCDGTDNGTVAEGHYNIFEICHAVGTQQNGFVIKGGGGTRSNRNNIISCRVNGASEWAYHISDSNTDVIIGSHSENCENGTYINGPHVECYGMIQESCTSIGLHIDTGGDHVMFMGRVVSDDPSQRIIDQGLRSTIISTTGQDIIDNKIAMPGIRAFLSTNGSYTTGSTGVTITNAEVVAGVLFIYSNNIPGERELIDITLAGFTGFTNGKYRAGQVGSNLFKVYDVEAEAGDQSGDKIFDASGVTGAFTSGTYDQIASISGSAITSITNANPAVMTVPTAPQEGQVIFVDNVGGMTELNERFFYAKNVTATTFDMYEVDGVTPVDSSAYGAYTSGGTWGTEIPMNESFNLSFFVRFATGTYYPRFLKTMSTDFYSTVITSDQRRNHFSGYSTYMQEWFKFFTRDSSDVLTNASLLNFQISGL